MRLILSGTDPAEVWKILPTLSGTLAFDVGANAGAIARLLVKKFDHVVAFEPCEESRKYLEAEDFQNLTVDPCALGEEAGEIELVEASRAMNSGQLIAGKSSLGFSWGEQTGTRTVEASTLDEATKKYGVPDFVKIDTEGYEVPILKGAKRLLKKERLRWLIEVHDAADEKPLRELLSNQGHVHRIDHDGYPQDHPGRLHHFYLQVGFDAA